MSARLASTVKQPTARVKDLKYGQIVRFCNQLCLAMYDSDYDGNSLVGLVSLESPNRNWTSIPLSEVEPLPKGTEVIVTAE